MHTQGCGTARTIAVAVQRHAHLHPALPGPFALLQQEVAKGFGWTLPTFTELDISKYLPLEVQLAEITLDVGPNDQGLVVAGVTVVLRVGEMNIAPFNLKEAEVTQCCCALQSWCVLECLPYVLRLWVYYVLCCSVRAGTSCPHTPPHAAPAAVDHL